MNRFSMVTKTCLNMTHDAGSNLIWSYLHLIPASTYVLDRFRKTINIIRDIIPVVSQIHKEWK